MSRNYDNWERLVAAVVKREQIWQLCHQDSISTISSDSDSDYDSSFRGSYFHSIANNTFKSIHRLRHRNFRATDLVRLVQDVQVSDQQYLAAGTKAVIKSLNTRMITEDEFKQHMLVFGNCNHENVATPWAYRFSQNSKLLVYDYYSQGSVFDMLHGNKSRPNWESCQRIALGAARGIAHIHTQCGGKLAHGNIKSSNIFVNSQNYGCVCDFGLGGIPVSEMGMPATATWWDALEYYTPEQEFKRPSQESDVYSFGLVLLELVTGRLPVEVPYIANRLRGFQSEGIFLGGLLLLELVTDMFPFLDSLYLTTGWSLQRDSVKMLQVAIKCLVELPEYRPTMSQVVLDLELHQSISF